MNSVWPLRKLNHESDNATLNLNKSSWVDKSSGAFTEAHKIQQDEKKHCNNLKYKNKHTFKLGWFHYLKLNPSMFYECKRMI